MPVATQEATCLLYPMSHILPSTKLPYQLHRVSSIIYPNTPDMLTSTRQVNIFLLSNVDALARVANSQYKESATCHSIPISDCNILNQTGITDSVNCQGSNKKQGFERWGILKEQLCQVLFQLSKNYSVSNPSIQCFKANYMSHEHPQIILIRLPG